MMRWLTLFALLFLNLAAQAVHSQVHAGQLYRLQRFLGAVDEHVQVGGGVFAVLLGGGLDGGRHVRAIRGHGVRRALEPAIRGTGV